VVVDAPEVIAAGHRRERSVERQDLETAARQVELADDLRAEQRDDIRADGKLEPGKDLFGDRRTTEHMAPLEDEHLAPRTGEVGRGGQPVVAAADHDDVVVPCHEHDSSRSRFSVLVARFVFMFDARSAPRVQTPSQRRTGTGRRARTEPEHEPSSENGEA
jgi:hypothetical protein